MNYKQIYDKLNDTIAENDDNINLVSRMEAIFNRLLSILEKSYFRNICGKRPKEYDELENICKNIIDTIKLVEAGKRVDAYQLLYNTYFNKDVNARLNRCIIKSNTSFYRMRAADSYRQYTKDSNDNMYHVPFQLRHLVGNCRYSISGFPTFYLSSSAYACWEEIKRCNLDYSNVALFKTTDNLSFLDMILPNDKTEVHKDNLLGFPLILASNLKVQNQNQNFTPEYIIPQLILECIIKLREEGIENKDKIAGVQYKSIHKDERDLRTQVLRPAHL